MKLSKKNQYPQPSLENKGKNQTYQLNTHDDSSIVS